MRVVYRADMPSLPVFQVDYPFFTSSTCLLVFEQFDPFIFILEGRKLVVFLPVNHCQQV